MGRLETFYSRVVFTALGLFYSTHIGWFSIFLIVSCLSIFAATRLLTIFSMQRFVGTDKYTYFRFTRLFVLQYILHVVSRSFFYY